MLKSDYTPLRQHKSEKRKHCSSQIITFVGVGLILVAVGIILLSVFLQTPPGPTCSILKNVTTDNVVACLDGLYTVALENGGNRAANTTGYQASVDFVVNALSGTKYNVVVQPFTYVGYRIDGTPTLSLGSSSFQYGTDFSVFSGSASGSSVGKLVYYVGEGCDLAAYSKFPIGAVALVKRGNCTFVLKVINAQLRNASAVIIFNNVVGIFSSQIDPSKIPAFSASDWVGKFLTTFVVNPMVSYSVTSREINISSVNVIAESPDGNENQTIVLGSHLDGVPAGSGINDNGSGSCINLELALTASYDCFPSQKLVFVWFGAEELGLYGSEYYLSSMTPTEQKNIALYLNFDMVGSPNYVLGIFSGSSAPSDIQNSSILIQAQFEKFFNSSKIPRELIDFSGGSDYAWFLSYGIPAGGLGTGAGGIKTYEEKDRFGGVALAPYDLCYHAACDTTSNIDHYALQTNLRAAAFVLESFAVDSALVRMIKPHSVEERENILPPKHNKFLYQ